MFQAETIEQVALSMSTGLENVEVFRRVVQEAIKSYQQLMVASTATFVSRSRLELRQDNGGTAGIAWARKRIDEEQRNVHSKTARHYASLSGVSSCRLFRRQSNPSFHWVQLVVKLDERHLCNYCSCGGCCRQ